MTLAILDKLNLQRNTAMPIYQHLAEQIITRINSGKLSIGDRLPTEHSLANQLGINRLTVRKSYQLLEHKKLVERRRGMGTFILDTQENNYSPKRKDNTIYILIPHPVHITLQLESSLYFRRIIYGASMGNNGNLIQTVPVCQNLENPLKHIDWDTVMQIPEGARVFVSGMWFKSLFPFLLKRNIHGLFLTSQNDNIDYPEEYEQLVEGKWNFITLDRLSAMEQAVGYLYSCGRRKIAVIKKFKNEPQHPFQQGMMAAYKKYAMAYSENLYKEVDPTNSFLELQNEIIELWQNTKFDALIVGIADYIKPVYKALTEKLGLRIPDDVALMSFSDNPVYLDFDVPVTAIDFPNIGIGREIVKIFNRKNFTPSESIFHSTIIERESTRKGAGAYVNHAFMPEISTDNNILNIN
jgi:DNA-binding transcriptional regulator YhcF (GntR family)